MCQRSLLPSSVSLGSELRGFLNSCLSGSPLGTAAAGGRGIIRPPPPPSVLRGALPEPGQQWLPVRARAAVAPVMAATPGSWVAGAVALASLPRWPLPSRVRSGLRVQGGPPAAASPSPAPPSLPPLSRVPLVPTHQEMGGKLGKGEPETPLPGGRGRVSLHPRPARTPLCSGVAGCLSIAKELLLKNSNSKGIRPVWGKE